MFRFIVAQLAAGVFAANATRSYGLAWHGQRGDGVAWQPPEPWR